MYICIYSFSTSFPISVQFSCSVVSNSLRPHELLVQNIEYSSLCYTVGPCWLSNLNMLCYAKSLQSCLTLCDPIDGSPPGSPVPGILQARTLEWLPFPSPMRESKVAQSSLTLSDPMDCSLPGFSVHGIFQARVLE